MSTVTFAGSPLDALEKYAGASDQDRELWLAERRNGVTATQVRDLYMKKLGLQPYSERQELIDQKLGRAVEKDISQLPFVNWGNVREPIIAARLEVEELLMPESRVFKHPDNPRFLASPDGLGESIDGQLLASEIKTAGYDLPPGSEAFKRKGYLFQVQWVMFVIGAVRCRFVVEERIQLPDRSFAVGPEHRYWIERDDALIAELVVVAEEFLAELDRQRVEGAPEADLALDAIAEEVLAGRSVESAGKKRKETAWAALMEVLTMGRTEVSQVTEVAKITFTPGAEVLVDEPDEDAARAAFPKEWAQLDRAVKRAEKLRAEWAERQAGFTKKVSRVGKPKLTVSRGKKTTSKKEK